MFTKLAKFIIKWRQIRRSRLDQNWNCRSSLLFKDRLNRIFVILKEIFKTGISILSKNKVAKEMKQTAEWKKMNQAYRHGLPATGTI